MAASPALTARLRTAAERYPSVTDAMLATGLLVGAAVLLAGDVNPQLRQPDRTTYLLTLAGLLTFYFRRRAPLAVLVVAAVPLTALLVTGRSGSTLSVGVFVLAYTVAAWRGRRETTIAAGVVLAVLAAVRLTHPERMDLSMLGTNLALFAMAFGFGTWAQEQRRHIGWVQERARLLERERESRAREAVARERVRIARELHDLVGHSLGVVAVQAGVAEYLIDQDLEQAREALQAIAATSRGALAEVRQMVGVLREDEVVPEPVAGLDRLDALAAEMAAAGVPVRLDVRGRRPLTRGVDVAAYRVVQEALTNVLKHAPGATGTVTVRYDESSVLVDVVDDGAKLPARSAGGRLPGLPDGSGLGLLGMRERVASCGGRLEAGPRPGGGFRVRAQIPVPA